MVQQHPYSSGRWLRLDSESDLPPCKILRTFEGAPGTGFTNSCTTLVEFPPGVTARLGGQRFVVKAFDPRFSTYITDWCQNKTWPASTSKDESTRRDFLRWYYSPVPRDMIEGSQLMTFLVGRPDAPRNPCYADVVRNALPNARVMTNLVNARVLPSFTDTERQLVAEEMCVTRFEYEKGLLEQATALDDTKTFPRFVCATRVTSSVEVSEAGTRDDVVALDSLAIVMEFIEGDTLAAWPGPGPAQVGGATATARQLCEETLFANAVALTLGLAATDPHPSNHVVVYDEHADRIRVRLLDAGGFHLLTQLCDPVVQHPIVGPQSGLEPLARLRNQSNVFYVDAGYYYNDDAEEGFSTRMKALFRHAVPPCSPPVEDDREFDIDSLLPRLMCYHACPLDTLFWQLIQLISWRAQDRCPSLRRVRLALILTRKTARILNETLTHHRDRQTWGLTALYRISSAFFADHPDVLVEHFARQMFQTLVHFKNVGPAGLMRTQGDAPAFMEDVIHAIMPMVRPTWDSTTISPDLFEVWAEERCNISLFESPDSGWVQRLVCRLQDEYDIDLAAFAAPANVSAGPVREPSPVVSTTTGLKTGLRLVDEGESKPSLLPFRSAVTASTAEW